MITHSEQETKVQFGTGKIGSVGLSSRRGSLTIQQLINEIEIGGKFDLEKDITELPKVVLNFTETSSIDSLVEVLQQVKNKMNEPDPMSYAYAC